MATLDTNRANLAQLQRTRSIADALTAQALRPRQIIHPYQGMAQLAEAIAGGLLGVQANKQEKRLAEERRQAMIDALGPQYETVPAQLPPDRGVPAGDTAGVLQQFDPNGVLQGDPSGGFPAAGPGRLGPVGYTPEREVMTSPGLLNDRQLQILMSLPPDQREAAWTKIVVDQFTQDPSSIGDNFVNIGLRDYKGPQGEFQGQFYREKAPPYRTGTIDREGNLTPVDSRYLTKPVEEQRDVTNPYGKQSRQFEAQDLNAGYMQSVGTLDQMFADIMKAGNSALSFTGRMSTAVNTLVAQAKATARTVAYSMAGRGAAWDGERLTALVDGKVVNESRLFDESLYDLDLSKITANAVQAQRIKTQAISLAYAMARADDPGGRLSEKDVELQLQKLGLNQGDYRVTLSALAATRQILDRNIGYTISTMTEGKLSADLIPVPNSMRLYYGGEWSAVAPTYQINGQTLSEGQRIVDRETNEVYVIKDGQPVPTGERLP